MTPSDATALEETAGITALFPRNPRFRCERVLGEGGMGVVFEAFDHERGLPVALKTLRDARARLVLRFKQEFRSLAGVVHENLIAFHDLFAEGGQVYFTMELVRGTPFRAWVTGERPRGAGAESPTAATNLLPGSIPAGELGGLDVAGLARLRIGLRGLVQGVSAVHQAGMLHRDLKPSNVLVTDEGRVVVLDFGLVTEVSREKVATGDRPLEGTIDYMSPEQGARMALGPASDWYQVGVMLYESLTGRLPFLGDTVDVLMDRQRFEPPPPSQLVAGVPEDLDVLCMELLRRNPAARPDRLELLRRLGCVATALTATGSRTRSRLEGGALVGRERHLAALGAAADAAIAGRSVVCEVHGNSGSGKSALAAHFLSEIGGRPSVLTFSSRCYEQEAVPFKAVDGLMDGLSQHLAALPAREQVRFMPRDIGLLARMFPVLREIEAVAQWPARSWELADPQEERRRAFRAVKELLDRLASLHQIVIALDDLQWGDTDSAELLAAVLGPPDPPPLLLLFCFRTEDREHSLCIRRLGQVLAGLDVDRREISVGPLSGEEARGLALSLLGGTTPASQDPIQEMVREAGGNPFFLAELVRHYQDHPDALHALVPLAEMLTARLRRLPEDAGRLLAAVALAGRPIPIPLVLRAAEVRDSSTLALLKAGSLVRTRRAGEDEVECYHDRIRETVLALLEPEQKRQLHARLGAVLATRPDEDPEVLTTHFLEAGDLARAADYAVKAATRAEIALAFDRAIHFYQLALSLPQASEEDARKLHARLGESFRNAGLGEEAAREFELAAQGATAAEALELRRKAAEQLLRSGRMDDGLVAIQTVLSSVGLRLPTTSRQGLAFLLLQRARLWARGLRFVERDPSQVSPEERTRIDVCWSVSAGLSMVDSMRGIDFATRHLLLALRSGDPARIARAFALEACFVSSEGASAHRRVDRLLAKTREIAERTQEWESLAWIHLGAGATSFLMGRFRTAHEGCDRAEAMFTERCLGKIWEVDNARYYALWSLILMGDLQEMYRRTPVLLEEAVERGNLFAATNLRTGLPNLTWLMSGQLAEARSQVREAMRSWPQDRFQIQHFYDLLAQGNIDLYVGDPAPSHARLAERWPALRKSLLLRVQIIRLMLWHVRGRVALESAARAAPSERGALLRAVESDARRLIREQVPYGVGLGLLLRAGAARVRGDLEGARAGLEQAAATLEAAEVGLFLAPLWRWQGELLGGDEGRALCARSAAWMQERGVHQPERVATMLVPGFSR